MLDCIKYHLENSEISLNILVCKFCKTVVSKIYDQSLLLSAGFFFFFFIWELLAVKLFKRSKT